MQTTEVQIAELEAERSPLAAHRLRGEVLTAEQSVRLSQLDYILDQYYNSFTPPDHSRNELADLINRILSK